MALTGTALSVTGGAFVAGRDGMMGSTLLDEVMGNISQNNNVRSEGESKGAAKAKENQENVYIGGDGNDFANITFEPGDNFTLRNEKGETLFQQGKGGQFITVGDDVKKLRVYDQNGKLAFGQGEMSFCEMLESGQLGELGKDNSSASSEERVPISNRMEYIRNLIENGIDQLG